MHYLKQHWQGKLFLPIAFWLNFVLLGIVLDSLEHFIFPPYLQSEFAVTTAVIVFVIVVRVIIYTWQVVGVLRACEQYIANSIDRSWAIAAQVTVVLSFIAILSATFSSYQNLLAYRQSLLEDNAQPPEQAYVLKLINGNTQIHLIGPLDAGITTAVKELLAQHNSISGIVLDSDGGRIYEGRGLAKLILTYQLTTHSSKQCMSACTTAFISGTRRTLAIDARLGFHQYKTYSVHPNLDIETEQQKDRALFAEQGVKTWFLEKLFLKAADDMWWPTHQELLTANVVHQINN